MPASRLRDRAASSASGSTCGSMSQTHPVLESGLLASAGCSAPRGPRKGGPGKPALAAAGAPALCTPGQADARPVLGPA
uniref:Isoform 4 of Transcriptional corepressor CBFA2T3 n=1 Tax=Homo sapiens TaxID=9606 RepID=O75081-5